MTLFQLSANARMTRPVRGFGPNDVDLRGTRSPFAATVYTSAADIGAQITAVPPDLPASAIAVAASLCTIRTLRSSSRSPHSRVISSCWSTA